MRSARIAVLRSTRAQSAIRRRTRFASDASTSERNCRRASRSVPVCAPLGARPARRHAGRAAITFVNDRDPRVPPVDGRDTPRGRNVGRRCASRRGERPTRRQAGDPRPGLDGRVQVRRQRRRSRQHARAARCEAWNLRRTRRRLDVAADAAHGRRRDRRGQPGRQGDGRRARLQREHPAEAARGPAAHLGRLQGAGVGDAAGRAADCRRSTTTSSGTSAASGARSTGKRGATPEQARGQVRRVAR